MACFDGKYPIELPAGNLIGKHLLEGVGRRAACRRRRGGDGAAHRGDAEPGRRGRAAASPVRAAPRARPCTAADNH